MREEFRTRCEINFAAISHNLQQIRKRIGKKRLIAAVVKADAYGHGVHEVARLLSKASQLLFAVATPDEGIALRKTIHDKPILILSCLQPMRPMLLLNPNASPVWRTMRLPNNSITLPEKENGKLKSISKWILALVELVRFIQKLRFYQKNCESFPYRN